MNTIPDELHHVVASEQFAPDVAVELAALADKSGFTGTVVVDRFQPWLPSGGGRISVWSHPDCGRCPRPRH